MGGHRCWCWLSWPTAAEVSRRLWGLLTELSNQLSENREHAEKLRAHIDELKVGVGMLFAMRDALALPLPDAPARVTTGPSRPCGRWIRPEALQHGYHKGCASIWYSSQPVTYF